MDDFELQRLKDSAREAWQRSWEAEDFSWAGLGTTINGQPKWPWAGTYVESDGRVVYEGEQTPAARRATVKDYWATDFDSMIIRSDSELLKYNILQENEKGIVHHFINLGKVPYNKSSSQYYIQKNEILTRIAKSSANSIRVEGGEIVGFDGRVQLVGVISDFSNLFKEALFLNATYSNFKVLNNLEKECIIADFEFRNCLIDRWHLSAEYSAKISLISSFLTEFMWISSHGDGASLRISNSKIFGKFESQNGRFYSIDISRSDFFDLFWILRARVVDNCHLIKCHFYNEVNLEELNVIGELNLSLSKFVASIYVEGSQINGPMAAKGAEFEGEFIAGLSYQIGGGSIPTRFSDKMDFCDTIFKSRVSFDDAILPEEAEYRNGFERAQFLSSVSWSKEGLHAVSIWAGARVEGALSLPWLDELGERKLLKQRTLAEAKDNGEAAIQAVIQGAQTLKQALLPRGDFLRAQLYHKLELQAKALSAGTPFGERLAGWAYGFFSDWGLSWHRPLWWLLCGIILFAGAYNWLIVLALGSQFGPVTLGYGLPVHSGIAAGIELSMSNALGPIRYLIGNDGPPGLDAVEVPFLVRFGLGFLSILQQIGSLALLFLSALALRRRFQIG